MLRSVHTAVVLEALHDTFKERGGWGFGKDPITLPKQVAVLFGVLPGLLEVVLLQVQCSALQLLILAVNFFPYIPCTCGCSFQDH